MTPPKVSVIMSVYNGEKYLNQSIESILHQDFFDFEFLIIDDGSSDNSAKIISSYSDPRIITIINTSNLGLITSLNNAIDIATGEYIIRMDCDDISLKKRISTQVKFMDINPKVGASGSFYHILYENKKALADFPITPTEIKSYLLFNSPIAHPTAIIRKSVLDTFKLRYSIDAKYLEDYDLWSKLSKVSELGNIKQSLLEYRLHNNQVSTNPEHAQEKLKNITVIRLRHLNELSIEPTEEEIRIHNLLSNSEKPENEKDLLLAEEWLLKIRAINQEKKLLDKTYFDKIIFERWLRFCFNLRDGKENYFLKSNLFSAISLNNKRKVELIQQLYNAWKRRKIK